MKMDIDNWRRAQGEIQMPDQVMASGMDWRAQLQQDSRQRIVNKIMETLKRHLPFSSGQEVLQELKKIAVRFEEKIYTAATSQSDYLRKISLKMLTMETKSQNPMANSLQPNAAINSKNPQDPASQSMQSQMQNQVQQLPIPMVSNQSQVLQQILFQNNIPSPGVLNSAGLNPVMPPVGGMSQGTIPNVSVQNPDMQNMSNVTANAVWNSMGQGVPANMYANSQRQIPGRQPQSILRQQQQQQPQQPQIMHQQQSSMSQHPMLSTQQQQQYIQRQFFLQQQQQYIQRQFLLQQQHHQQQQTSQQQLGQVPLTSLDSSSQTANATGGDWQDEIYQKIKSMHEMYYPELNEMYQRMAANLQQHDSHPQQPKNEQLEKLRFLKLILERLIMFLRTNKNDIHPHHKEKIVGVEKQIVNILNSNRPRKPVSSMQQGQLTQSHMHAMQQSQQQQPQMSQMHSNEGQMNSQMQAMNVQGSMMPTQHNILSSGSGVLNSRQSMLDGLQPGSNIDPGQGNALNQMQQQGSMNSLQQNSVGGSQQMATSISSQNGLTSLQSNVNSLQSNSNILQPQQIKQEQQMFSAQQLKQYQQRQMQQQYMQRLQLLQQQQQQQQQTSQQQLGQLPGQQMMQLNQMNDTNDMKMRHQMGAKSGALQQHSSSGQRTSYHHQQMKPGAPFSMSSQNSLQAASPQIGHHSSPQIEQQSVLTSHNKAGTPLLSANSPFVAPSPSTSMAPSPMPGDSEKMNSDSSSQMGRATGGDAKEVYQKQQQQHMLRQPLIQQQQSGQLPGEEVMVPTAYIVLAVCILLLLVLMMLHCGGVMLA